MLQLSYHASFSDKKGVSQVVVDLRTFKDEAALRDFFAENLEDLLGQKFLTKEYSIGVVK